MKKSESPFLFEAESPAMLGQLLAAMGRTQPVYYDEFRQAWIVLRHRDITAALRNPEVFSNTIYKKGPMATTFSAMDGEEHAQQRRIYGRGFSPRAIQRYEDEIIGPAAHRLLDRVAYAGSADLVEDFCAPLPIMVMSHLLGMTPEYVMRCREWIVAITRWMLAFDDQEIVAAGWKAHHSLVEYMRPCVEAQIRNPGPNLTGELIRGQKEEGKEDVEQIVTLVSGLLVAGFETTTWMLAGALGAFLLHPAALARVQRDRTLLMPAIEESARWGNAILGVMRLVMSDVEVGGVTLRKGSTAMLCTGAAHYDEDVYLSPATYDIDRRPQHLLFIAGPHLCMGAPLARLESRVGLSILLDRLPQLRLSNEAKTRFVVGVRDSPMFGPIHLPVLFDAEDIAKAA